MSTSTLFDTLMTEALLGAEKAASLGEVPIGAVIAHSGRIIARAHNLIETKKDATAHAEVLAIRQASEVLGNWRLSECVLCVTLEPCVMCMGAIKLSRIPFLVFGANAPVLGAAGSLCDLTNVGPELQVVPGVKEAECAAILKNFFAVRRIEEKQAPSPINN